MTHDDDKKAAEEWAKEVAHGELSEKYLPTAPGNYFQDYSCAYDSFLAGVAHARRWIPVSERLPTKEERDSLIIEWWHDYECCPYSGRFESYDGKRIWIESRNEWSVAIPLTEFTHWRAVNEPPPPEPQEGE
jgi:hypothetical protein